MPPQPARSFLAVDLGAESGRAVLGSTEAGVITTREVHRFQNEPVKSVASLRWDAPRLLGEIRTALSQLDDVELAGVGVDAWGVDYALLDEAGELLENPFHYRDDRTAGVMDAAFQQVAREEIYRVTGIQFMPINTLYQLLAAQRDTPELLRRAKSLVTIPDLFRYWLTGKTACEVTSASTTQMLSAVDRTWASDLLERLGLPARLPAPIIEPGTIVGPILPEIAASARATAPVIAPASHDTASAFAAVAARDGTAFISSGTWSLVGTELDAPILTGEACRLNFTNEGGIAGTTRLLKNVMGLWMLQGCRRAWSSGETPIGYGELTQLAADAAPFRHLVDPDHESFLSPPDMTVAIDDFCGRTDQPSPETPGAYVRAVLESLALTYCIVINDLERLTGKAVEEIRVVGGGSKNRLLNQFTADATGRRVLTGPDEATALGNIAVRVLATGNVASLADARAMVERSFRTDVFEPRDSERWAEQLERFRQYGRAQCA